MTPLEKLIKEVSNEELHQFYLNAFTTYGQALGHTKAEMNKQRCEDYREEMTKRGMEFDPKPWDHPDAIFNGDGAY